MGREGERDKERERERERERDIERECLRYFTQNLYNEFSHLPLLQSLYAVTQSPRGRGRVLQAEVGALLHGL